MGVLFTDTLYISVNFLSEGIINILLYSTNLPHGNNRDLMLLLFYSAKLKTVVRSNLMFHSVKPQILNAHHNFIQISIFRSVKHYKCTCWIVFCLLRWMKQPLQIKILLKTQILIPFDVLLNRIISDFQWWRKIHSATRDFSCKEVNKRFSQHWGIN